jgi:peptidoglycan/LPS O-acetylase OafA/YrhL
MMGVLRLVLALLVATAHLASVVNSIPAALSAHAIFAVRAFFLLSGFYMALVLRDTRYRSVWSFYVSRLGKLLPVYWIVAILTFSVAVLIPTQDFFPSIVVSVRRWHDLGEVTLAQALYLVGSIGSLAGADTWMWLGFDLPGGTWSVSPGHTLPRVAVISLVPVPQAWSLGVELLFYLTAPLFVRLHTFTLVIVTALSLGARAWFYHQLAGTPYDRALFPLELVYFLGGILAFRALAPIAAGGLTQSTVRAAALLGLGLCASLECIAELIASPRLAALATFWAYASLACAVPFLFLVSAKSRWDAGVGALSYPLYVVQFLVFGLIYLLVPSLLTAAPWWACLPPCIVLLVAAALLLDRTVARPVDRLRGALGARVTRPNGKSQPVAVAG